MNYKVVYNLISGSMGFIFILLLYIFDNLLLFCFVVVVFLALFFLYSVW